MVICTASAASFDWISLEFAEQLIKKGATVNAVCMRREERTTLIRSSVRKYRNDARFKLKPLPVDSTTFNICQTSLSLANRAEMALTQQSLSQLQEEVSECL